MATIKPACADERNAFGKPDAGNPHVRFEEGGGADKNSPPLLDRPCVEFIQNQLQPIGLLLVKEDYLHGFEGDVGLAILIKISCNDGVMTSKCDTRRWDARVCMMN